MVLSRLNGLIFFAPIPWINICINFQLVEMYRSNWNLNPKKTVPSNSLRARVWTIRQIWICFPVQGCGRMKRKLGSIIPPQYYGPSALAESQIYMRSRQRPWFHKEYSKEKPKQIRAGDFFNLEIKFTGGTFYQSDTLKLGLASFGPDLKLQRELQLLRQKMIFFEKVSAD